MTTGDSDSIACIPARSPARISDQANGRDSGRKESSIVSDYRRSEKPGIQRGIAPLRCDEKDKSVDRRASVCAASFAGAGKFEACSSLKRWRPRRA